MDVDTAANHIFNFTTRSRPGARYIVAQNRLMSYIETLLPDTLLDMLVFRLFSM